MDRAEQLLQDAANTIFSTTELDNLVPGILTSISKYAPWKPNETPTSLWSITKATTASSLAIALTAGDKWKLLSEKNGIRRVEYPVDENPRQFRSFDRYGDVIEMGLDNAPSASDEDVYLYLAKVHLLTSAIGTTDTAGAVKTAGAVGDVALALKSLGTGAINEGAKLTIAGDTTVYHVISTATIGTNEATVSIWPTLQAAVDADAVVTFALENTLTSELEELVARLIAAEAAIYKAPLLYQQANAAITSVGTAGTALGLVAARITQAVADATSGRTKVGELATIITAARAEIDLINPEVDQAIADLDSGRALLNTVPVGNGGAEYQSQANAVLSSALGYVRSADALLKQAQATENIGTEFMQLAGRELQAASSKLNEASGQLQKGRTELAVVQSGKYYEQWGLREKAETMQILSRMAEPKVGYLYPRN